MGWSEGGREGGRKGSVSGWKGEEKVWEGGIEG